MATTTNKHGLSRYLPRKVAREVRKRSKFGCVNCRCGLYQYEHIDPPFESATSHNPAKICCLCGKCHDLVTRRHLSKATVSEKYLEIQRTNVDQVEPPTGPLDFHNGKVELLVGGITYDYTLSSIVRYHGEDVMIVRPGTGGRPAEISAIFTDESGAEVMRLCRNEWQGSLDAWDIEVVGPRLIVRRAAKQVVLDLRLEAPGRLIIEHLDMRFGDCHLLISGSTHAIGRYVNTAEVYWMHAGVGIIGGSMSGIAIEFSSPALLKDRFALQKKGGKYMADAFEEIVIGNVCGAMVIPAGLAIGTLCGTVRLSKMACGTRPLDVVRETIFTAPEKLPKYLGTGMLD